MEITINKRIIPAFSITPNVRSIMRIFGLTTDDIRRPLVQFDTSIDIKPGKICFVTGPSGTGKSVLLREIAAGFAQNEKGITLPRGNPVEKIRKPSDSAGRDRRLTADEWTAFTNECKKSRNPWLWSAVQLAVETAMRQGELLGLTWGQIDRKRKLILLLDPEKIKNEEPRAVPLSPAALDLLDKLPRSTSGKVLPVERLTLYHAFSYACDRAKIKNFTFHDLRHEALSRLAERGDFSVLELAAVSGHKTLQMLKRYTHLQAERLADKLAKKKPKRA